MNTDCPVCAADYTACTGKADDEENDDPENNNTENNMDGQQCICETACTEEAVNADCPVCAADYANCAQNAGGGVNPSEGAAVLENVAIEEAGIAALAEEGVEAYAVGDPITHDGINYVVTEDGVEVGMNGHLSITTFTIPESFEKDGVTYRVTGIGDLAFYSNDSLTSVTIPGSVTSIGENAFSECSSLGNVTISEGVTSIGIRAFNACSGLTSVTIPGSVKEMGMGAFWGCSSLTNVKIQEGVKKIGANAFQECGNLRTVEIPDSVTRIDSGAFGKCSSLSGVTLPEGVKYIGSGAFAGSGLTKITIPKSYILSIGDPTYQNSMFKDCVNLTTVTLSEKITYIPSSMFEGCINLNELNILIAGEDAVGFPGYPGNEKIGNDAFDGCPFGRKIVFWNADGTKKLTGEAWEQARDIYKSNNDGDTTDNLWYGWLIEEPTTYAVTIQVNLDDRQWTDHKKTFALTKDGTSFVTNLGAVEPGTYTVCDVTGLGEGEFQMKGMNTNVIVPITDAAASATVDYYKVTFYDGVTPYGPGTPQEPQTILKDVERVAEPTTKPTKPDHTFDKWVTAPDGNDAFDFAATPITAKDTKIYAKWTEDTVTTYYTVTFYDGTTPYGADTPQRPQSVADGQKAAKPEAPKKAGWKFDGWKTVDGNTDYNFDTPVTGDTSIYASWRRADDPVKTYIIDASATEGGSISPVGKISVNEGDNKTFTITSDEGYRIKSVLVNGTDRKGQLTDGKNYTFTDILQSYTIVAEFERDGGENPDPNPNPGGDNPGGGGDNTNPGDDNPGGSSGGGDGGNSGGGSGSGGNTGDNGGNGGSDSGNTGDNGGSGGGDTNSGNGSGAVNAVNSDSGNSAGNGQAAASAGNVSAQAQAQSGGSGTSAGSHAASDNSKAAGASGGAANGREPKTGDASYLEVYATLAMIAGLTYLILYMLEESRGMSEREKEAFIAAFIRWGKKGGAFRKGCAMAAIFCLLAYYHTIGKCADENAILI